VIGELAKLFKEERAQRKALEQRVKELEARPELKYCGPWIEGQPRRQLGQSPRGLWLAIQPRPDTPGTPSSGWKFVVKEGTAR
jgi:hypothetical protein